jgi:hypothetical protein
VTIQGWIVTLIHRCCIAPLHETACRATSRHAAKPRRFITPWSVTAARRDDCVPAHRTRVPTHHHIDRRMTHDAH